MRAYIFTERERKVIQAFFEGRVSFTNRAFSQIRTRIKLPSLKSDVELYLALERRLAEPKTAVST
jgi:hypothetical protein